MSTIADINAEARALCDADSTSYTAADLLRRINYAYEQVIGWILDADGTWQWDDTNYTNLPVGTQTLVNAQKAYSFNDKFLEIESVQVKDVNGNWIILKPIEQRQWSDTQPLEEDFETDGLPEYYDKVSDDTIKLYPAPDNGVSVTLASGLKVKFRRTADVYTSAQVTTGTKEPGFASPYHVILSYMAALPYCLNYKKDRVPMIEKRIMELKADLITHYTKRSKDETSQMTMGGINFR